MPDNDPQAHETWQHVAFGDVVIVGRDDRGRVEYAFPGQRGRNAVTKKAFLEYFSFVCGPAAVEVD
jgi:hypothetical protein